MSLLPEFEQTTMFTLKGKRSDGTDVTVRTADRDMGISLRDAHGFVVESREPVVKVKYQGHVHFIPLVTVTHLNLKDVLAPPPAETP